MLALLLALWLRIVDCIPHFLEVLFVHLVVVLIIEGAREFLKMRNRPDEDRQ